MDMEEVIRAFVTARCAGRLGNEALTRETPLFSTGLMDSFGVLELIAFLEQEFDIEIDPLRHEIDEFDTIVRIEGLVRASRGHQAT